MTSELIWQRSELLGIQVITRDNGKRLGVVSELLVDVDRREVVALGLRDSAVARVLPGLSITTYMYLDSVQQVGDVVLVDNSDVIEDIDPERYSTLINSEVVTENSDPLGRVRGFKFNIENGEVEALIIASVGLTAIPEGLISTYELPVEEISSTGPNRIIVFEGAEDRLVQLSVGVMEKLGLTSAPWERDEEEEYMIPITPAENQLGTGEPLRTPVYGQPYRPPVVQAQPKPVAWAEDNWDDRELEPVPQMAPRPQEQRRRYYEPEPEGRGGDPYGRDRGYAPEPNYYGEPSYGESRPEPRRDGAYGGSNAGGYGNRSGAGAYGDAYGERTPDRPPARPETPQWDNRPPDRGANWGADRPVDRPGDRPGDRSGQGGGRPPERSPDRSFQGSPQPAPQGSPQPAPQSWNDRPGGDRSMGDRSMGDRPSGDRPSGDRPMDRQNWNREQAPEQPSDRGNYRDNNPASDRPVAPPSRASRPAPAPPVSSDSPRSRLTPNPYTNPTFTDDEDEDEDVWADTPSAPPLNLPTKQKQYDYEV
jgi:sporulation protein YlmC with PRC-barrel domain